MAMVRWLAILVCCVGVSTSAAAQEFRGAVTGRIVDASGAVLPGVTVTATNVATNVVSTRTSNAEGFYAVGYLTPGTYTVVAELSGFKKLSRGGIEIRVGDRLVLDLRMELGAMEETVTVLAGSPLLELGT